MRVALVNPHWRFEGSTYFGCREPHLPLELGYAKALLEASGHEALLIDAHFCAIEHSAAADLIASFDADMTVVTTAPTYLFWRCAQPELAVPRDILDRLGRKGGMRVVVGPHGSVTPGAVLHKLHADIVIRGECEEAVAELADKHGDPRDVRGAAYLRDGRAISNGGPRAARFVDAPALRWPNAWIERHSHHHHRFDREPVGPGAEVEASRGCPFSCTFCAKIDFRDKYRRRELSKLLVEIDGLAAQGVRYLYFIDEIFLPDDALLHALAERGLEFGIQTRLDLWKPVQIELLGRAGCVSVEAGVESLTREGRAALNKKCRASTEVLTDLLLLARANIPFVQANLIVTSDDDPAAIARWREHVRRNGIWANDPVPLYPYPSSPEYVRLFGAPDDRAWERAHGHYLRMFDRFSEIQSSRPLELDVLEENCR